MNPTVPSLRIPAIKPQVIRPDAKYGRNISIGVPKIVPKTKPIAVMVTDIPIVIQSCPKTLRRYDCLMSCQPSIKPIPSVFFTCFDSPLVGVQETLS